MVVLGGVTRLTKSGLSMTDWRLTGSLPPLTHQEWQAEFDRYKQFPEYQKVNHSISLQEFKSIYWMEYAHRMFGRFIGVAFALPLSYFLIRRRIPSNIRGRTVALLGLGGTQGLIGWWMVKSGLETPKDEYDKLYKEPRVSPYRLAVHLISAFGIYVLLVSTAIKAYPGGAAALLASAKEAAAKVGASYSSPKNFKVSVHSISGLVGITAFSGAFVAGNSAGLVYNEFPLMGGRIVPEDYIDPRLQPVWRNSFENSSLVQFQHRALAITTLFSTYALAFAARRYYALGQLSLRALQGAYALAGAATVQASLGIATLLTYVPVSLAALHQAGALGVMTAAVFLIHLL